METAGKSLFPWKEVCCGSTRSPQVRLEEAVTAEGWIFTRSGDSSPRVSGWGWEVPLSSTQTWVYSGLCNTEPDSAFERTDQGWIRAVGDGQVVPWCCRENVPAIVSNLELTVLQLWASFSQISYCVHQVSSWSRGRTIPQGQICSLYKILPWEASVMCLCSRRHGNAARRTLLTSCPPLPWQRCSLLWAGARRGPKQPGRVGAQLPAAFLCLPLQIPLKRKEPLPRTNFWPHLPFCFSCCCPFYLWHRTTVPPSWPTRSSELLCRSPQVPCSAWSVFSGSHGGLLTLSRFVVYPAFGLSSTIALLN